MYNCSRNSEELSSYFCTVGETNEVRHSAWWFHQESISRILTKHALKFLLFLEWLPTPVFWPREFRGLYSPWTCKESDTTEQLSHTNQFQVSGYCQPWRSTYTTPCLYKGENPFSQLIASQFFFFFFPFHLLNIEKSPSTDFSEFKLQDPVVFLSKEQMDNKGIVSFLLLFSCNLLLKSATAKH